MNVESIAPRGHMDKLSGQLRASDAVASALDLSPGGRDLFAQASALSKEERDSFLKILAQLLQRGVVGTETLAVNGRPHRTFVSTRAADPQLAHAQSYRPGARFDSLG